MKRLLGVAFPFLAFAVLFAGGMRLQHDLIERKAGEPERYRDLLYLPSTRYVRLVAADYDHFLTDFFFLRVIQTFGASYAANVDLGQLWAYFDTMTDLDPHFLSAYTFGNLVLGEEQKDREKGLAILEKGVRNNPDRYRLPFEAAFYSLWTLNDLEGARRFIQLAEKAPDAPEFVFRWEGFIDEQMGRYHAAYMNFLTQFVRSLNANEETMISINQSRLRSSVDEWYKAVLLEKAMAFHEKNGYYPLVVELEEAGALLDVEWPDFHALLDYLYGEWENDREIAESDEAIEALAQRFMRTGWLKMPLNPSSHPVFKGYVIWPGQQPVFENGNPNPLFVGSELNVAFAVKNELVSALYRIQAYQEQNEGACPEDLATVSPTLAALEEPWGGEFVLDPSTCTVFASTYPNLGQMLLGYRRL